MRLDRACFVCGKVGHIGVFCPTRSTSLGAPTQGSASGGVDVKVKVEEEGDASGSGKA
jgi:hypothetical protein